jgi:hypothetical protein
MESNPSKNGNLFAKHIQEKLDNNEDLDIGDIPNNGWFHKLNGTIQSYILTKLNGFAKENKDEYDIPNIVKNIGFINKDFAKALNDWQFYNNVPKVFVKDTDGLSLQALEWLDFLSCLGFDIMLFSPMGELLPEKKNHYKDIKEFTLDKFDMEYKEYNDEETYYIRKLTSSFNSLDLSIFALMTTLLIGFFVLRVAIPDLSLATPNENIILIPVIVIMILAIILGIPGTFKENKLIKQNEGIKAFTKAYHDCLDGENELIAYIIVALFYVLVFSIIIRWYKFSLFCIICGIIYVMIYEKNKMQIKKIL